MTLNAKVYTFFANSTWEDEQIPVLLSVKNIFPLAQSDSANQITGKFMCRLTVTILKAHFNHQIVLLPQLT